MVLQGNMNYNIRAFVNYNGTGFVQERGVMNKKKILIVDDEADLVNMVKMRLESDGFGVSIASNGREAIEKIDADKPDLILLDVLMPAMDGYTAFQELKKKESTRNIPVVVMTAKRGMQELFEAEGAKDYIKKPFSDKDLLARIRKVLGL